MTSNDWSVGRLRSADLVWGQIRAGSTHACRHCGVILLTGEESGFCCGTNGSKLNSFPPLPVLPIQYNQFLFDPKISSLSRALNLVFSFASLESSVPFFDVGGPPGFWSVGGRIYHRVRPEHQNSAVHWLLYDKFDTTKPPHKKWADTLPSSWIEAVKGALLMQNPFVRRLNILGGMDETLCPQATILLHDSGECHFLVLVHLLVSLM
ncbi:uncharacterized protein BXZ73DRAFT_52434 [Epithele typhae]|uniref:uncharacterized protein n=1 Tax=Epithele typhae TaxID=378194 RepID=UPI0020085C2B|nr:uncharacterized protein BXZ73DRAFT_52434 [Epithele typhae]KAH9920032.1 hypothetical protein BXZ73DRAFT_52434 [Epithele typhae]